LGLALPVWPRCLSVIVLVKPATVVQWHRHGLRLYWRWRSKSGRPAVDHQVRELIRKDEQGQPALGCGAPRIHGELLKLGIEISQATVGKYMARRLGPPSPTWRSFLRNHADGIAALDMFVVPSATFRLLFVMLILAHDRRKIVRFDVTQNPTAGWLSRQVTEAFPWETAPRYCATGTPRTVRSSPSGLRPWESLRSSRRHVRRGRTLTSSV